jgi:hypothetical protein
MLRNRRTSFRQLAHRQYSGRVPANSGDLSTKLSTFCGIIGQSVAVYDSSGGLLAAKTTLPRPWVCASAENCADEDTRKIFQRGFDVPQGHALSTESTDRFWTGLGWRLFARALTCA